MWFTSLGISLYPGSSANFLDHRQKWPENNLNPRSYWASSGPKTHTSDPTQTHGSRSGKEEGSYNFSCATLCARTLHFPSSISCWPPMSILGLLGTLPFSLEIRFSHMTCFGQRHVSRRDVHSFWDVVSRDSVLFCTLDFSLPWQCTTWWSPPWVSGISKKYTFGSLRHWNLGSHLLLQHNLNYPD